MLMKNKYRNCYWHQTFQYETSREQNKDKNNTNIYLLTIPFPSGSNSLKVFLIV